MHASITAEVANFHQFSQGNKIIIRGLTRLLWSMTKVPSLHRFINMSDNVLLEGTDIRHNICMFLSGEARIVDYGYSIVWETWCQGLICFIADCSLSLDRLIYDSHCVCLAEKSVLQLICRFNFWRSPWQNMYEDSDMDDIWRMKWREQIMH